MSILPMFVFVVVVVAIFCYFAFWREKKVRQEEEELWEFKDKYLKRTFLFDSNAEFRLFKILNELYSDKFYIFPQINYSHVVDAKTTSPYERRSLRSRIDKKSADFVLCDKERVVPQLVIELDGYTHDWEKTKRRDGFIDELMKDVGMPIIHLKTGDMSSEAVKRLIDEKLQKYKSF